MKYIKIDQVPKSFDDQNSSISFLILFIFLGLDVIEYCVKSPFCAFSWVGLIYFYHQCKNSIPGRRCDFSCEHFDQKFQFETALFFGYFSLHVDRNIPEQSTHDQNLNKITLGDTQLLPFKMFHFLQKRRFRFWVSSVANLLVMLTIKPNFPSKFI